MEFLIKTEEELAGVAEEVIEALLNQPLRSQATVLALIGELGAGKTAFTKYLLKALGVTDLVSSPTFILMRPYPLVHENFSVAYHIDVYRLEEPVQELEKLGIEEILKDPKHLVIIEWADMVEGLLPRDAVKMRMGHEGETSRLIQLEGLEL